MVFVGVFVADEVGHAVALLHAVEDTLSLRELVDERVSEADDVRDAAPEVEVDDEGERDETKLTDASEEVLAHTDAVVECVFVISDVRVTELEIVVD